MKALCLTLALLVVGATYCGAEPDAIPPFVLSNVSKVAAAGGAVTSAIAQSAYVDAIAIDVSGGAALSITNGAEDASPDITGSYFLNGTYGVSNAYLRDDGTYNIYWTNTSWFISTNQGLMDVNVWSNSAGPGGIYTAAVVTVSGEVSVVSFITDIDIDVEALSTGGQAPSRTILGVDDVGADVVYYPRIQEQTIAGVVVSGQYDPIPLVADLVRVTAYDSSSTGVSVSVNVILRPNP
ncbi:MAG: hypothetical protein GY851_00370 [bacterium]|nr:hypothetical protein [bacterium]